MNDLFMPVALKRRWVPEWLFRIASLWLPAARLLCEAPRCFECGVVAVAWTPEDGFECDAHYRASLSRGRWME